MKKTRGRKYRDTLEVTQYSAQRSLKRKACTRGYPVQYTSPTAQPHVPQQLQQPHQLHQ